VERVQKLARVTSRGVVDVTVPGAFADKRGDA
jgi:hypothetical protein